MSLLGRLEDLSLPDIAQIVYLSRRTGILEIILAGGRHTVLFRHGLIVNAASPESPDLLTHLIDRHLIRSEVVPSLRRAEAEGVPIGTSIVVQNLMGKDALAETIRERIDSIMSPLFRSRDGEFNFILSDSIGHLDIEYEPDVLFEGGGFPPQQVAGGDQKARPLKSLVESVGPGKAMPKAGVEARPAPPHSVSPSGPTWGDQAGAADDNVVPFPAAAESEGAAVSGSTEPFPPSELPSGDFELNPFGIEPGAPNEADRVVSERSAESGPPAVPIDAPAEPDEMIFLEPEPGHEASGRFKVAGGPAEVAAPEGAGHNVVLFERNPLIRVAARRAFGKRGIQIAQFGVLVDVQDAVSELMRSNSFFVTFLELTSQDRDAAGPSTQLLQRLKRRNRQLPVVVIDDQADLRRRHRLLSEGADLYLTRPGEERLQPGLMEEELALFADELVLFAMRAFEQWSEMGGSRDAAEAGRRFYERGEKQQVERSFGLLRQLINELSNPNDIGQVTDTILRLARECLERCVVFMVGQAEFRGLGGFGITGSNDTLAERAPSIRIPRGAASILEDVVARREGHRGKIRRTPANVELIEGLGILPTEVIALPLLHEFKVVGILYGDNAENRGPIDGTSSLEVFLSQAGYAFGSAIIASRNSGMSLQ
jgi:CheY-like chemotaxis protein